MSASPAAPPTPEVTVCVSTRNRAARLPSLLRHLERQTLPLEAFEVVILDDGSTDDTWAVLERERATSPLRLTVLGAAERGGAAAGRNACWQAATAPLCAFTDDDCRPTPQWLEQGVAAMRGRRAIGAGRVGPTTADWKRAGAFSRLLLVDEGIYQWWATANLFVLRADLAAVGGFDEDIDIAGEDTDLGLRLLATGVEPLWIPGALVHHDVELSSPRALIREQKRWIDVPGLLARHPDARERLLHRRWFWKPAHLRLLLLAAGVLAAPKHREALALALPWLHLRMVEQPLVETTAERTVTLPAALALDAAELVALARGSVKHRTVML